MQPSDEMDVLNNVDICITCVSDKPPVLPLREELMSLGIEIVLTAHGTGAKASQREAMNLVKKFREQELAKEKRRRLLPRSQKRQKKRMEKHKRIEEELLRPKGLSYEAYSSILYGDDRSSASSLSSLESFLAAHDIIDPKRKGKGWGFLKPKMETVHEGQPSTTPERPPLVIQYPSLEYLAVQDAYAAFGSMTLEQALSTLRPVDTHESENLQNPAAEAFESFGADSSVYNFPKNSKPVLHLSTEEDSDEELSTTDVKHEGGKPTKRLISATGGQWWYENPSSVAYTVEESDILDERDEQPESYSKWSNSIFGRLASTAACCDARQLDSPKQKDTTTLMREWDRHQLVGDNRANDDDASFGETKARKREHSQARFYYTLKDSHAMPGLVLSLLEADPDLVKSVHEDGRLALHAACDRALPDRFNSKSENVIYHLISDITSLKELVELVAYMHLEACIIPDNNGDLPSHLLARRLLLWEATWRKKLKEPLLKGSDEGKAIAHKIYRIMGECLETVVRPVAVSKEQCQNPGSVGWLLPLHAAAIFGVWYDTIKALLEACPEAARHKCNLDGFVPFIRSDVIALQLHDRLSVLFPKPHEFESVNETEEIWAAKNFYNTSDLLFCYNPEVLPYRWHKERLKRIEHLVISEMESLQTREPGSHVSEAVRMVWIWMCLFESRQNKKDNYLENVERIFSMLPKKSVRYLASIKAEGGEPLIDVAPPEFARLLIARLGGKQASDAATLDVTQRIERVYHDPPEEEDCVAAVCKNLFNIRDDSVPTSFIILPYKLKKEANGKTVLASQVFARVAVKFADCLVQMTDHQIIRIILKRKHPNKSICPDKAPQDTMEAEARLKTLEIRLLSLFEPDGGYLYLLDETDGSPVIPEGAEDKNLYPILVRDPVSSVRTFLPLMISAMILMKGRKSFPVFAKAILAGKPKCTPSNWLDVARVIMRRFFREINRNGSSEETLLLYGQLVEFIAQATSNTGKQFDCDGSEWNREISLISTFVQNNDPTRTFAGLSSHRTKNGISLWKQKNKRTNAETLIERDTEKRTDKETNKDEEAALAEAVVDQKKPVKQEASPKSDAARVQLRRRSSSVGEDEATLPPPGRKGILVNKKNSMSQIDVKSSLDAMRTDPPMQRPKYAKETINAIERLQSKNRLGRTKPGNDRNITPEIGRKGGAQVGDRNRLSKKQANSETLESREQDDTQSHSSDDDYDDDDRFPDLRLVQTESTVFGNLQGVESRDSLAFSEMTEYAFETQSEFGAVSSVSSCMTQSLSGFEDNGKPTPLPLNIATTPVKSPVKKVRLPPEYSTLLPKWVRQQSDADSECSDKADNDLPLLPRVSSNEALLGRKEQRRRRPNASSSLEDVHRLKRYLEKQTSHLEKVRHKLEAMQADEQKMVLQADYEALDDLAVELTNYDVSTSGSTPLSADDEAFISRSTHLNGGKTSDNLLERLCELEERILTREIDLQHLRLDLHMFELDAAASNSMPTDDLPEVEPFPRE